MSTRKTLLGEQQHGDEAAALPPPPEAHPAGAPTESLRQADEPPCEATLSPNPSHPDGPPGTAGALTHNHVYILLIEQNCVCIIRASS